MPESARKSTPDQIDGDELAREIQLMRESLGQLDERELVRSLLRERDALRNAIASLRGHGH